MMRQLTQGEVEYLKKLLLAHSNMGKVIADLMVAIASDSEPDVAKSHKQLVEVATYIKLAVDPDYRLIYESKPGPKEGPQDAEERTREMTDENADTADLTTNEKLDRILAELSDMNEDTRDVMMRLDRIESRLESLAMDVADVRRRQERRPGEGAGDEGGAAK